MIFLNRLIINNINGQKSCDHTSYNADIYMLEFKQKYDFLAQEMNNLQIKKYYFSTITMKYSTYNKNS